MPLGAHLQSDLSYALLHSSSQVEMRAPALVTGFCLETEWRKHRRHVGLPGK